MDYNYCIICNKNKSSKEWFTVCCINRCQICYSCFKNFQNERLCKGCNTMDLTYIVNLISY